MTTKKLRQACYQIQSETSKITSSLEQAHSIKNLAQAPIGQSNEETESRESKLRQSLGQILAIREPEAGTVDYTKH